MGPLASVVTGVVLAALIFVAMLRFLPQGGLWGRMVLHASVGGEPHLKPLVRPEAGPGEAALVGRTGVAVTGLFPSGQVQVAGRRYEAHLTNGFADIGTEVLVVREAEFGLEVEVVKS
jgi:membrane-bound serine protease (ClpP class)